MADVTLAMAGSRTMQGMEDSLPGKLRVWDGWSTALASELPEPEVGPARVEFDMPIWLAEQLFATETMNAGRSGRPRDDQAEPYTLQWYLEIEQQRHGRQGRWIPRLLEFAKHSGETLLGIGAGLGTDWIQYARYGAKVVVCSSSSDQLALVRRNFALRDLIGRFLHAPPTAIPLENSSIDVACLHGLPVEVGAPDGLVEEIYRVLKPGGKVLAVMPAQYDVDFWQKICFPWKRWLARKAPPESVFLPKFTAWGLRRLFGRFVEHRVYKRQLRRREVPHVWRWLPLSILQRLFGRVLVVKAFKPLSAAMAIQAAA